MEIFQIETRIDEISLLNDADYHDVFRTSKRELNNGEYTLDVIYSKQKCDKWLEDNNQTVYYMNKEYLEKFWKEFPNGVIDFG